MSVSKKRICLLGPTYPYRGGIAHHTTLLCITLRKDHDTLFVSFSRQYPKILFPGHSDRDTSKRPLRGDPVEYLLDSLNPLTWLLTARRIAAYQPDILVIPWWVVFWAPQFATIAFWVKRSSRAKILFLCHNVVEHEGSILKKFISRQVLTLADSIVTQSRAETEKIRKMVGQHAEVTTGFHPSYPPFVKVDCDPIQIRKTLGLSGNILLFFGFVRSYKGLDILLDALPKVAAEHDMTLLVVGEFWRNKQKYLNQIAALGLGQHVRIIDGYVPNEDIPTYFTVADLVVQPYNTATGSGICQLALAFGKPVIATRIGSLAEVVVDGVNGRLVPPGDAVALAQALINGLKSNNLKEMKKNAAKSMENYSWDNFVGKIVV